MGNFAFLLWLLFGKVSEMFNQNDSAKKVREITETYQNNTGQQDIFMECLRSAYNMGYLQWKEVYVQKEDKE